MRRSLAYAKSVRQRTLRVAPSSPMSVLIGRETDVLVQEAVVLAFYDPVTRA
jgi:hypothetical protein